MSKKVTVRFELYAFKRAFFASLKCYWFI